MAGPTQTTTDRATNKAAELATAQEQAKGTRYVQVKQGDAKDWEALGLTPPDDASTTFAVTEYEGPKGTGWELITCRLVSGVWWQRVDGEGPEADERNHDWQEVTEAG